MLISPSYFYEQEIKDKDSTIIKNKIKNLCKEISGLNIGCLVVTGHALQIQRMHRERLTITGRITCLTYGDGGTTGCGG